MLSLRNSTPYPAALVSGWSWQREQVQTLVVKTSLQFTLDGALGPLPDPIGLVPVDQPVNKDGSGSLLAAGELAPFKQDGECYLFGTVHPRQTGVRATLATVSLEAAGQPAWAKAVAVSGETHWRKTLFGLQRGEPAPLEPQPLRYEDAFGGSLQRRGRAHPANPVGRGYAPTMLDSPDPRLPAIEDPEQPLVRPGQTPPVAGFGPLPASWTPRRDALGTPDDSDEQQGCPYPDDAQPTLHNAAPLDQRFDNPFQGGETLTLQGFFHAHPQPVVLELPSWHMVAALRRPDAAPTRVQPVCDTLIIDTDRRTLAWLFRCSVPLGQVETPSGELALMDLQYAFAQAEREAAHGQ